MSNPTFRLTIETDNAAFEDTMEIGRGPAWEIARILREVATRIDAGDIGKARDIRDINGNVVGQFELKQERP